MSRCSGCVGACTCLITGGTGITVSGSGADGDAFLISSSGGGGGSVPDQHILIASNILNESLDSGTPYAVPWDSANVLGAYVLRGTDVTWAAGNPTRLTINTTGVYDIAAGPAFSATSASLPVSVYAEIYVNGATDIRGLVFSSQLLLNNVGALHVQNNASNGWAFSAGNYVELRVGASDGVSGPDAAVLLYAGISVTRRV